MKKHLFTIRWEREGTRAFPTLEFYRAFNWPDNIIGNEAIPAAARLQGVPEWAITQRAISKLPAEAKEVYDLMSGLLLRCRYSPETQGPYLIDDPDDMLSERAILMLATYSENTLKQYRV